MVSTTICYTKRESIQMVIEQQKLENVVQTVYDAHCSHTEDCIWPDCSTISEAIIDALYLELSINPSHCTMREIFPIDGYRHYIVEINSPKLETSCIIDGSFHQFADEADTPISVGPIDTLNPFVIVCPKEHYIFFDW